MAKAMTVTTRSDLRKQSTEQARQGKYRSWHKPETPVVLSNVCF
jgi:hypothetical protein